MARSIPGAQLDGTLVTVQPSNLKRAVTLAPASRHDILATLHLAASADTVLLAVSSSTAIDAYGELCINALRAQGIGACAHLIVGMDQVAPKRKGDTKRFLTKQAEDEFPDTKVHMLEAGKEASILW